MKRLTIALFYLALLFLVNSANGQILKPVKWKSSVNQISAQEYELVIKAKIDNHRCKCLFKRLGLQEV